VKDRGRVAGAVEGLLGGRFDPVHVADPWVAVAEDVGEVEELVDGERQPPVGDQLLQGAPRVRLVPMWFRPAPVVGWWRAAVTVVRGLARASGGGW
jgi:hypothetical protein